VYFVTGNTITSSDNNNAPGLLFDFLHFDNSFVWAVGAGSYQGMIDKIGQPVQIYISGGEVTTFNQGGRLAQWISKANNEYFQTDFANGTSWRLTKVIPNLTLGTNPVATYQVMSPETKYNNLAVAYQTAYNYPGVSGTPVIYRAGDYGVGAYTNSVSLKTTYST